MLGLWIALGVLAALILLIWRLRLGVLASFGGGQVTVDLRIGPFRIRLTPRQKREKSRSKKTGKPGKLKAPAETKKKIPRPTAADLKDAWRTLWPAARRALERTRRGIRVAPLRVSVTLGGGTDPAAAAELYGGLCAMVWTGMPALEALVEVPDPQIHIGIDFDAPATDWEGELGVSLRMGTLIAIGLRLGIPVLKWLQTYFKKQESRRNAASAAEHPAA